MGLFFLGAMGYQSRMNNASPQQGSLMSGDIQVDHWSLRVAPHWLRPYVRLARLDRPIGTWLLLFPCWWSLALASPSFSFQTLWYAALFAVGAVVMRAAGCAVNDIADRDFDAQVERTKSRPIASGDISRAQAGIFVVLLLGLGLVILLQFNRMTILVGILSLALVFPYPLMKRITYWPQAWLGLTFNWGALVGWAAATGRLDPPALALYGAGLFWTLGYDTIYAHQDKEDDMLVGVKSSALALGRKTRVGVAGFYALALGLLALAGYWAGLGPWFAVALIVPALHLASQVWRLDIDDPANCLRLFKSNHPFGWLMLAAFLAGRL